MLDGQAGTQEVEPRVSRLAKSTPSQSTTERSMHWGSRQCYIPLESWKKRCARLPNDHLKPLPFSDSVTENIVDDAQCRLRPEETSNLYALPLSHAESAP